MKRIKRRRKGRGENEEYKKKKEGERRGKRIKKEGRVYRTKVW